MQFFRFTVILKPEKENKNLYYNVSVPALPEIATFGESINEARFMAQDALELVVLSRLKDGESIHSDKKPKNIPKGAIVDEVMVTVAHQVNSAPVDYVKKVLFKTA